jgi:hypothetical protein
MSPNLWSLILELPLEFMILRYIQTAARRTLTARSRSFSDFSKAYRGIFFCSTSATTSSSRSSCGRPSVMICIHSDTERILRLRDLTTDICCSSSSLSLSFNTNVFTFGTAFSAATEDAGAVLAPLLGLSTTISGTTDFVADE